MLIEFDHAQDLAGSEFAVKRFEKYRGLVWKEKQIYMRTMIYRAHRKHDSNPCALYTRGTTGSCWFPRICPVSRPKSKARMRS